MCCLVGAVGAVSLLPALPAEKAGVPWEERRLAPHAVGPFSGPLLPGSVAAPELPGCGSGMCRKPGAAATELGGLCGGMCLSRGPWKSPCQQQCSPPLLRGCRGCRVWDRQYDSSATHSEDAGSTAGQLRSSGTPGAEGHRRGAPRRRQRCAARVSTAQPSPGRVSPQRGEQGDVQAQGICPHLRTPGT